MSPTTGPSLSIHLVVSVASPGTRRLVATSRSTCCLSRARVPFSSTANGSTGAAGRRQVIPGPGVPGVGGGGVGGDVAADVGGAVVAGDVVAGDVGGGVGRAGAVVDWWPTCAVAVGTVCSGIGGGEAAAAGVVEKVEGTDTGLAAGPGSISSGFGESLGPPCRSKR